MATSLLSPGTVCLHTICSPCGGGGSKNKQKQRFFSGKGVSDKSCKLITQALEHSNFFDRYKPFICADGAWVRSLTKGNQPVWRHISGKDVAQLRPLPTPPQSDQQRPWKVFPQLAEMAILPFDGESPSLLFQNYQWNENEIHELLEIYDFIASDSPHIQYFTRFLHTCAIPYQNTDKLCNRVIELVRKGFVSTGIQKLGQHRSDIRHLAEFIPQKYRRPFSGRIPPELLAKLWSHDTSILLIPKDLDAQEKPGNAIPDTITLKHWLELVNTKLQSEKNTANMEDLMEFSRELLKCLGSKDRSEFLRNYPTLRIIAVRDAKTSRDIPVSLEEIQKIRSAGTLFGYAQGLTDNERFGYSHLLAKVLPEAGIFLVKSDTYKDIFPDDNNLPKADDQQACLVAVGNDESGIIGDMNARRNVLEEVNDPGANHFAIQGLRYLLHGSPANRMDHQAPLWIPGREHSAWAKLWRATHDEQSSWKLIDGSLAGIIADSRLQKANTRIIDPAGLIDELKNFHKIDDPHHFTDEERNEILSKISDSDVWL